MGMFLVARFDGTVSTTGARLRSTPARDSCRPQDLAAAVRVASDQLPWVSALGIRVNPGPWRTCTWPPSWSADTQSGTPAVAVTVVSRSALAARYRTGAAPAYVRPVRMRPPTWCTVIAEAAAADNPVAGVPTTNSWPMRCASVIRENAACARLAAVAAVAASAPV